MTSREPGTHLSSPIHRVPNEVWDRIFERTIPPTYLFHVPAAFSVHSRSFATLAKQQQMTILLVCKAWYNLGLRYLYHDVFIRWPQQALLLHTVLQENKGLTSYIRHMDISCLVSKRWHSPFSETISKIITICPRLSTLDMNILDPDVPHAPLSIEIPPTITRLGISYFDRTSEDGYRAELSRQLIHHFSRNLIHFSLNVTCHLHHALLPPNLEFPLLESLIIHMATTHMLDFAQVEHWTLPSFQNFTVQCFPRKVDHDAMGPIMHSVLQKHGKNLRYLHLKPPALAYMEGPNMYDISSWVALCPALEHLVLHPKLLLPDRHPSVHFIDVWDFVSLFPPSNEDVKPSLTQLRAERFPSLLGIRSLAMGLSYITDLPIKIPPRVANDGTFECGFDVEFGEFHLKYHEGEIAFVDTPWPDESEEDDPTLRMEEDWSSDDSDGEFTSMDWDAEGWDGLLGHDRPTR